MNECQFDQTDPNIWELTFYVIYYQYYIMSAKNLKGPTFTGIYLHEKKYKKNISVF